MKRSLFVIVFLSAQLLGLRQLAQAAGSPCNSPNGSLFNLEPRPNAVVQVARSIATLPNPAGNNNLVVAVGADARGLVPPPSPIISEDAFYVERTGSDCTPDFEGGLPSILTPENQLFIPITGSPSVIADPARDQFYIVDLDLTQAPDENGIGIYRTTSANLNSTSACPSGTEFGTAPCFTTVAVTNITGLNAFLDNPSIAVDPRTTGVGAGDLYTVVTQRNSDNTSFHISLTACTNGLNCGNSISISAKADMQADFAWVQVRPDGGITISYRNTTFPGVNKEEIKFVTCAPAGAPNPPTCSSPVLVTTVKTPVFDTMVGDLPMRDQLYPRHVNRLESDGKTVTTFMTYDQCDVAVLQQNGSGQPFCPKTDVVLTSSTNNGATWSPVTLVTSSPGQQFFGAIANDTSTGTVNIAYYSTENDFFELRPQVFLTQIPPGTTKVGTPQLLTSASADVQASPPISLEDQPAFFGDRIGLAVTGTGIVGQSTAYVSFTWTSVAGTYNGVSSPDVNNHLTTFQY
ncbi:MAG: hypothetical protein WBV36_06705 [Terriglobales bacterium]